MPAQLPVGIKLIRACPAQVIFEGKTFDLLEDYFDISAIAGPAIFRGPYYTLAGDPGYIYDPDTDFKDALARPLLMIRTRDEPTELDEPLRAFTRKRLAELE